MGICRIILILFALLWALAVALLLIGTFGWFGQDKDPLSGVFLIPLGLPWNRIMDAFGFSGIFAGLVAPAFNLAIIAAICRWRRTR